MNAKFAYIDRGPSRKWTALYGDFTGNLLTFFCIACLMLTNSNFACLAMVNPACECVHYNGDGKPTGSFNSPDFKEPYSPNIECILYTFIGNHDEIVELSFAVFKLQQPDENGQCSDYIRLYDDMPEEGVNEESPSQETVCGHLKEPIKPFYSKGPVLIFEFHTDSNRTDNDLGFVGDYRFLKKIDYETNGNNLTIPGAVCDFAIPATSERRQGNIFSSNYPYYYTPNKDCHYWLTGLENDRIKITIESRHLTPTSESCAYAPESIYIYDGMGPRLGSGNEMHRATLIGHFCSNVTNAKNTVTTSGRHAFIKFKAGANAKRLGRGFHASFAFVSHHVPHPTDSHPSVNGPNGDKKASCDETYSSDNNVTYGVVSSPGYPHGYAENLLCRYTFSSAGNERVQIIFDHFDLYNYEKPDERVKICNEGVDRVTAYVDLTGALSVIRGFCGVETPPQLMSSENSLTLEFRSFSYQRKPHRKYDGFRFFYRFVTDFGVETGEKDPTYVCGRIYNSTLHPNGTVKSPNCPGFYPRKTECHYTFQGQPGEQVRLFFTYFDVNGRGQCQNDTASDYLQVSNYNTTDIKVPRYCGDRKPPTTYLESERDFYHMRFYSDGVFDATGFYAHFQFVKTSEKGAALMKAKPGPSAGCSKHFFSSQRIVHIILLLWFVCTSHGRLLYMI